MVPAVRRTVRATSRFGGAIDTTTDFKDDSSANRGSYISADAEIARQAGDSSLGRLQARQPQTMSKDAFGRADSTEPWEGVARLQCAIRAWR